MKKYHIVLTDDERLLLKQIDLRTTHASHDEARAAYNANQRPILALVRSLSSRNAIPQERIKYWNDPDYNPGRVKASRKGLFERNSCTGDDIYTHPHFLVHLRYFLFGADLPEAAILAFEKGVGDPAWFSLSDVPAISKLVKDLTRRYGLDKSSAENEFFKLGLDLNLGLSIAVSIRRAVQQIRP